jgi:DNA-binding response OmpR family regulator
MMKNTNKVIVVEDDPDINSLIAYNLNKEGFAVEQVFDGAQAILKLKSEGFDIVILDIMLPGADGFQVCKAIQENNESFRTSVIMVSAKNSPQDKLYANILGAEYYFSKPFSVSVLVEAVKEIRASKSMEFEVKLK